ncbi:MAG: PadR family transcriptional regulator [Anaerolineae bacterium]
MTNREQRDLTSLEYIVMGLLSMRAQSGYSIMTFLEGDAYGWSASPGTIYPILKRLEKQGIIEGELEIEHETRPRKIYRLSELGGSLLDNWLREVPRVVPASEQRELAKWKFQFMEWRLPKREVIQWLDNYLDALRIYDFGQRFWQHATVLATNELGQTLSVHRQLVMEAALMELNTLRTWLEMAKVRLYASATATNEMSALPPEMPDSLVEDPSEPDDDPGDFG